MILFFGVVSAIVRHSLVRNRAVSMFGSDVRGHCTTIDNQLGFCNGTSVLNDGCIPALSGVSNNLTTPWADQLFTMKRVGEMGTIIMSFELNDTNHNHVELYLFNCPSLMGINTPSVRVYFDESFRPGRLNRTYGVLNTYQATQNISCDDLLPFCVEYQGVHQSSRYINLEFPFESNATSDFVFLGEVTFVNGYCSPHDHKLVSPTGMFVCQFKCALSLY